MEITGKEAATAGSANEAEPRSPTKRLFDYACSLAQRESRSNGDGEHRRVLVVDDDPAIRMLCAVNLEIEGLVVLEAADGRRALEQARYEHPDLVVTDVMMPGLDGWQVAEELLDSDRTSSIPIIFLTARAEVRDRARGLDLGGIDYVTKPFNPVELAPLVLDLIDRVDRGERDELRREKIAELRDLIEPV